MVYSAQTGDVADAAYRAQTTSAIGGNYLVEPAPKASVGNSSTDIEITVSSGVAIFGNSVVPVDQQTVTLPDGPAAGSGTDGGDPDRVDLITIDSTGAAGRMVGQPLPPHPEDDPNARFPHRLQPVPPTPQPADDVVVVAAVWVPTGTTESQGMFADWVIPRGVPGDGLNELDLIPGRDLQAVLDNAREGETLVGIRGQPLTLDQPLKVNTPNITIRDINLVLANGTATSDTDDMLRLQADGVSVENVTLDGNMANQPGEPDGVTVAASDCNVRRVRASSIGGHVVNLSGDANAVVNTTIEDITARDCRKDALMVQGTGTAKTRARNIQSYRSALRGTVTVRNGADSTRLQQLYGEDQSRTVEIEDFGPSNSNSAAVNSCWMDVVIASGCDQILNADVSPEINHRGFKLSRAGGDNFNSPPSSDGLILFNYCQGVRISDSVLATSVSGTNSIYVGNTPQARIDHTRIRNQAAGSACIKAVNPELLAVDHNQCNNSPGRGINIITDGSSSGTYEMIHVEGNRLRNLGGEGVYYREDAGGDTGTIDRMITKDNIGRKLGGPIVEYSDVSGAQVTVKDNMG